jgi:signal transduction histidine kinase
VIDKMPTLARRSTGAAQAGAASRRLELAERLLATDGAEACAERALAWLAGSAVDRALVVLRVAGTGKLAGLAGLGVAKERVHAFSVDPTRRAEPLARALTRRAPVYLARGSRGARAAPFEGRALHAFALRAASRRAPASGLLLASANGDAPHPDLVFAARVLGERLAREPSVAPAATDAGLLEGIFDVIVDPILLTDADGNVLAANGRARRLFLSGEVGRPGRRRTVARNNQRLLASLLSDGPGAGARPEVSLVDPIDESVLLYEPRSESVLSERGTVEAVVTFLHDRTEAIERDRLYEQLKRAYEDVEARVHAATAELAQKNEGLRRQAIALEQASALKSQFLANVSHEFRTPLNAILGYTQMVLQGVFGDLRPPQRRSLARIDSNGRHLLEIINEILDISRIEAGRMPLDLSVFDVKDLIAEVMEEVAPTIQGSPVAVTTDLAARFPAMRSDRKKVKQIVLNLLGNAIKFTPRGSVRLVARFSARTKVVTIAIKDTGIGIDPGNHERVFEDFQQVDSSPTRPYSGTGLGLSICRRLVAMLDGRISLESKLGVGSTFTLILPQRIKRR